MVKLKMRAPSASKIRVANEAEKKRKRAEHDSFEKVQPMVHLEPKLHVAITLLDNKETPTLTRNTTKERLSLKIMTPSIKIENYLLKLFNSFALLQYGNNK